MLGPLRFTLFVNDMPNNVQFCELALYAEGTCLFTSSTDPGETERKLNEDILSLSKWLKDNKLMVNPKKCEVMFICTHQRLKIKHNRLENCHVIINGNEIKKVDSCKYLGVVIDRNLSWNSLTEHVKKKNQQQFFSSYTTTPFCSKPHLNQLQILQNQSLRIGMDVDYMFPTTLLYETLKLDRLQIRCNGQNY